MKTIVVALGGNAFAGKGGRTTISKQFSQARTTLENLAGLVKGNRTVITHGNGPQVGNILIRVEEALGKAYSLPLEVCVAESEGEIGYMIEQTLQNVLNRKGIRKPIATMLTRVLVGKKDPAFKVPTKPIGPFYTKRQAAAMRRKGLEMVEDSGRGYRRVVASPKPLKILEAGVVGKLLKQGVIVIAAGGGGIPVVKTAKGFTGIEAVIDKDYASACLAKNIKAEELYIVTGVQKVALNYNRKNQKNLSKMSVKEAEQYLAEGHFPRGSMGPKIEAAISFLKSGGKKVLVTNAAGLRRGKGTVITKK